MDGKLLGSRIKSRRVELNMTQGDIAEAIGVAVSTIQRYETGSIQKIKLPVVEAIARHLRVNANWLVGKSEVMELSVNAEPTLPSNAMEYDLSKLHRIPVLGRISAGLPLYADENIEGYTYTDLNGGAEYFALRVTGDSMNALRINEGDIVIVRKQPEVENGEVAVVLVDGENATLKRFYQTESSITLMPQSTNPTHVPQVYDPAKTRVDVLGKVVKVEFML